MFKQLKSIEDQCVEFKKLALKKAEDGQTAIELKDLESFFSYRADHYESTWIPKEIREQLRKIGVFLTKRRGRTIVMVEIEED